MTVNEIKVKVTDYVKDHKPVVIGALVVLGVGVLLLGVISALSGSGSRTNVNNPPVTTPIVVPPADNPGSGGSGTGSTVVLNMWGAFFSPEVMKPVIAKYESENPTIKINYTNEVIRHSDIVPYRSKIDGIVGSQTATSAPDIFMVDSGWSGSFAAKSAPAPATVLSAGQLQSEFHDFVATDFVNSGNVIGIPVWVDNLAIVYNKKLWTAAGLTEPDNDWIRFADVQVPALTKKQGSGIQTAGFAAGTDINAEFWYESLLLLIAQNKLPFEVSGQEGFSGSPDATQSVDFYKSFIRSGSRSSWSDDFNPDVAAFLEGKLATFIGPSWRLNDIVRYNEAYNLGLDIGISALPQLQSATQDKANIASYWGYMVNSASTKSAAAWNFLSFLASKETLQQLQQSYKQQNPGHIGFLYPRVDLAATQTTDRYLAEYAKSLDFTVSWYVVDEQKMRSVLRKVFEGKTLANIKPEIDAVIKTN